MNQSEINQFYEVKKFVGNNLKRYDFWFVYDKNGQAIEFEGGYELPLEHRFKNEYSLLPDSTVRVNFFDDDVS